MVGKKTPLVFNDNGHRRVIGIAEVEGVAPGEKVDVDIENVGPNVVSFTVDSDKLDLD